MACRHPCWSKRWLSKVWWMSVCLLSGGFCGYFADAADRLLISSLVPGHTLPMSWTWHRATGIIGIPVSWMKITSRIKNGTSWICLPNWVTSKSKYLSVCPSVSHLLCLLETNRDQNWHVPGESEPPASRSGGSLKVWNLFQYDYQFGQVRLRVALHWQGASITKFSLG